MKKLKRVIVVSSLRNNNMRFLFSSRTMTTTTRTSTTRTISCACTVLCFVLLLFVLLSRGRDDVLYTEQQTTVTSSTTIKVQASDMSKKHYRSENDSKKENVKSKSNGGVKNNMWREQVPVDKSSVQIQHMLTVEQLSSQHQSSNYTLPQNKPVLLSLERSMFHQTRFEQRKNTLSNQFPHNKLFVSDVANNGVNILNDIYGAL